MLEIQLRIDQISAGQGGQTCCKIDQKLSVARLSLWALPFSLRDGRPSGRVLPASIEVQSDKVGLASPSQHLLPILHAGLVVGAMYVSRLSVCTVY